MYRCELCNKITKTASGLSSHKRFCDGSGSKLSKKQQRDTRYNIPGIDFMSTYEIKIAKLKQLWTFEDYIAKQRNKKINPNPLTLHGLNTKKQKCRDAINKRYAAGWMPNAGRCKKITYISPIAGIVKLDGTWEEATAKYLDTKQINWRRNTKKFDYIDNNFKYRQYTPDFYLIDSDTYIEVKGYITNLDKCKWKCFQGKLEVWTRDVLINKEILGK